MIKDCDRFWALSGNLLNGAPWTWHVVDWDQRRWIAVTGPEGALPNEEAGAAMVRTHVEKLAPHEVAFTVSEDGNILSVSSDPDDDVTSGPSYRLCPEYLEKGEVLKRTRLTEIARIAPATDMVVHQQGRRTTRAVFKYAMIEQHMERIWDELHILRGLRDHPSILSLDRVILDEVENRVLGFTTPLIPGGDLEKNPRPFRFKWLQQLTEVVDDVNLSYGIMHQDIAPRNLLVDENDNLILFDFGVSRKIGHRAQPAWRNDVDGVIFTLYELLTHDVHYREASYGKQDVSQAENLAEWPLKAELEEGTTVTGCRDFVNSWAAVRRTTRTITRHADAKLAFDWPEFPEWRGPQFRNGPLHEEGKYYVPWQRLAEKV